MKNGGLVHRSVDYTNEDSDRENSQDGFSGVNQMLGFFFVFKTKKAS